MARPLVLLLSLPRRLLLLLLLVVVVVAFCAFPALAHPGAVADGRASCGEEYSTTENAYTIPDIREAWYLRRLATCSNPVFWTKFEVVESGQPIYVAVISPELERFEDELQFNGILYGPGLSPNGSNNNGMSPIPSTETIPPEVTVDEELAKLGAGYISSPARFDTCDFVDTNPVMKSFSDLHNDRCMEEFDFPADFSDDSSKVRKLGAKLGAGYISSPARFDTCDFVDTNPVMKSFSDLHNNRCMEEFDFPADFSDALQQSTKVWSWWLYSFNHVAAEPGTYYLQTWLTTREDVVNNNTTTSTQVLAAQGKYEMTLGPWTWVGTPSEAVLEQAQEQGTSCSCSVNALDYKEQYFDRLGDLDGEALALAAASLTTREDVVSNNNATTSTQVLAAQGKYEMTLGPWTWVGTPSEAVLEQAQEQGTSCSCSVNALDYKEQYFDRLGDLDGEALALAQLQGASCQDPSLPEELTSPCHTIPQRPYMSDNSATEWSGSFVLEANRTYEWSFHSYFQGMEEALYDYPDPGMYVHIVSPLTTSVEQQEVDAKADQTLTASVESENDFPKFIVAEGETFNITDASQPQFVRFTETSLANSTTILLQPTMTGTYFFYTQHVPSEFMAHFLRDQETGRYIFPYPQFLYVEEQTESSDPSTAINLHTTILQVTNM
eukprot:CAMPEP_0113444674 /NCGR_PEP_ID=MMETSP0014_2-20120614/2789_1 /TAXON_ID=2857 /ORGANISM="Nitzschia sp." /LENGTH=664 /DNA_ID=CAMNT_0000335695 /DNA_START=5 /DNA_END=1996 /DNA_ORIENTATION=+ /assembly_acc=CAM_ASM_000159